MNNLFILAKVEQLFRELHKEALAPQRYDEDCAVPEFCPYIARRIACTRGDCAYPLSEAAFDTVEEWLNYNGD